MPNPATSCDKYLKRKGFIPSTLMQVSWEGDKKRVALDKTVMDYMNESYPVSAALLIYMAVKVRNNNTVHYTIDELMTATHKNRVTIKRALCFLIDSDYVIPVRNRPSSQMML